MSGARRGPTLVVVVSGARRGPTPVAVFSRSFSIHLSSSFPCSSPSICHTTHTNVICITSLAQPAAHKRTNTRMLDLNECDMHYKFGHACCARTDECFLSVLEYTRAHTQTCTKYRRGHTHAHTRTHTHTQILRNTRTHAFAHMQNRQRSQVELPYITYNTLLRTTHVCYKPYAMVCYASLCYV